GHTWYPNGFMMPIPSNEPYLSSALDLVGELVSHLADGNIPPEKVIILGFSQGACLASEFVARNAMRYGGLAALTGGLIGPDGTPRDHARSLDGTPLFM